MIYGRQDPHIKYDGRLETYKRMHEAGVVVVDIYMNTYTVTYPHSQPRTTTHPPTPLSYIPLPSPPSSLFTLAIHPLIHHLNSPSHAPPLTLSRTPSHPLTGPYRSTL